MKWIITLKKATASSVNVAVVFIVTSPFYILFGLNVWRIVCIALFFVYALLLSRRCLGQVIAKTYQNEPTNAAYAALYTASTATLLWWIWVPLDLALANGLFVQIPCLAIWGNTAHGLLAKRRTMTEQEYLFECIALKGECPDCRRMTLTSESAYRIWCKSCNSQFGVDVASVHRIEVDPSILKTGKVLEFRRR